MMEETAAKDVDHEIARKVAAFVKAVEERGSERRARETKEEYAARRADPNWTESVSIHSPDGNVTTTMRLKPGEEGKRTAREISDFLAEEQKARESGQS